MSPGAGRGSKYPGLRTVVLCWFWSLLGIYGVGWAVHTTNLTWAPIFFWGGLAIGNGGILFTLVAAWHRLEKRGDQKPSA